MTIEFGCNPPAGAMGTGTREEVVAYLKNNDIRDAEFVFDAAVEAFYRLNEMGINYLEVGVSAEDSIGFALSV